MPEVEPIDVQITADVSDLTTGLNEGKRAMSSFGDSAQDMSKRVEGASYASKTLFRGLIEMRVALMSTEHVLKLFGVTNEFVAGVMSGLNAIMDVAITVMAIYRAASFLVANADLARAAAGFLAGIAEVSAATLFLGTAAAVAAVVATWGIINALSAPRAEFGGIVQPRPGGTLVRVAEAGQAEAIIPLGSSRGGITGDLNLTMNVYSNDPDMISRVLGRKIEQMKMAGF